MRGVLLNTDNDPDGLREVKEKALKELPKGPFSRQAKVHCIKAGPGCGKSYIIRELADENDLVPAPFAKLSGDYRNLKGPTGNSYNLTFTQHKSLNGSFNDKSHPNLPR